MSPAAQAVALADDRTRLLGYDRVLAILREGFARVVHDRAVVVGSQVVAIENVLVEVVKGRGGECLRQRW